MRNLKEAFESSYADFIMEYISSVDIIVADEKGNIIQTNENFEYYYGCRSDEVLGKSVFDLEKEGLFKPSSIARVLESKKEVTLVQDLKNNKKFIVTAVPIKNKRGDIIRVVCYSNNAEGYFNLKKWSDELHDKIDHYNIKLHELNKKQKMIENILDDNQLFDYKVKEKTLENIIEGVITKNRNFKNILDEMKNMAKYDVNILLLGESGVGKTMLAKKIHLLSEYRNGEFVEINCGAIPQHLIESELFGYTKGSFTGASNDGKRGLLEIADKGTIFLDEICELPLQSQVKLLKAIQDKTVRRIGGTSSRKIDCRIIAATNKNLEDEVKKGNFRLDLLYRLNTVTINIPSLKERREDIQFLSEYLVKKYNEKYNKHKILSHKVIDILNKYSWPGNIREMENVIQRLVLVTDEDMITDKILPKYILNSIKFREGKLKLKEEIIDLNKSIEEFERKIIKECFEQYKSSVKVAKALNISQATAARKIKKYVNC